MSMVFWYRSCRWTELSGARVSSSLNPRTCSSCCIHSAFSISLSRGAIQHYVDKTISQGTITAENSVDGTRCGMLVDQRPTSHNSRIWSSVYNEPCARCGWIRLEMMLRLRGLVAEVEASHILLLGQGKHTRQVWLLETQADIISSQGQLCLSLKTSQIWLADVLWWMTAVWDPLLWVFEVANVNKFPMWSLFMRTYEYGWKRKGGLYVQVQDAF